MKHTKKFFALLLALLLAASALPVTAAAVEDEAVAAVIAQLESIDSLQQMQNKRYTFSVKNNHYDTGTTDQAIADAHLAARTGYETYVSEMFAARLAAQQAYDALSDEQKAQIDPALASKLSTELDTLLRIESASVTPATNEYTFEAVKCGTGYGYEVSHHMVSGNIPQTFVLVNAADGKTSWTPSGKFVYGESNYDVTYCCDVETSLAYGTHYRRINLEDSGYYGTQAARHIRAILQNAYPYLTMDEMKASLKAGGLSTEFVDSLTRSDMISAVQMAVWTYANAEDGAKDGLSYFASVDTLKNDNIYFHAMHDFTNECWDWLPGKRQRTYDADAAYRVNNLAYYLCTLEGVDAADDQIVISDVEVTRAQLLPGADDTYEVGMYVRLNQAGGEKDYLKITVTSFRTNDDGTVTVTNRTSRLAENTDTVPMAVKAHAGDSIRVTVEGTQYLAKGVYFYEPEGGRNASQSLVGISEGQTSVYAEELFTFEEDITEMGLRIYKTTADTGSPLSGITFHVYSAQPAQGETLHETPTASEIAKYQIPENLVASIVTDSTGYAAAALEAGTYLVVEEHNADKVKAPVSPFYIHLPMSETVTNADGSTTVQTVKVVSVYPKNEPVIPPEEPPILPPTPDDVFGKFQILKHDAANADILLPGARFVVYRAATPEDTGIVTVVCDGVQYAAVPLLVDGEELALTTDEKGQALSPDLPCGTYFLVETKAPVGYNLRNDAVRVSVVSDLVTPVTTVPIGNQKGVLLPETGGVGTAIFTVSGLLLVVLAASLLVLKKRSAR